MDTANPTPAAVEGLEGHQVEGFDAGEPYCLLSEGHLLL